MRLAERFAVGDAAAWWDGKSPGEQEILLGYELLRETEEARELTMGMRLRRL